MGAVHLELLVEEPSMEAFLRALLPRLLPDDRSFQVYPFQGKHDLLKKLEGRLRGYSACLPHDWRIMVVVDRDHDDCRELKQRLDSIADRVGLCTPARSPQRRWELVNRIAIEELEAWYFGDWNAVCQVYPRVRTDVPSKAAFRDPDAIAGGTWEAFERIMQRHGYFRSGLNKLEAARAIGAHVDVALSSSMSFLAFCGALEEAIA